MAYLIIHLKNEFKDTFSFEGHPGLLFTKVANFLEVATLQILSKISN